MKQSIRELVQTDYIAGVSLINQSGEISYFTIPEANVFSGVGDGWYRMYLDSQPLCLVKVKKRFSVQVKLYPDAPRTIYSKMVEEEIPWQYVDAGSIIKLVKNVSAGKKAIPYWQSGSLPKETEGFVGTPSLPKSRNTKPRVINKAAVIDFLNLSRDELP